MVQVIDSKYIFKNQSVMWTEIYSSMSKHLEKHSEKEISVKKSYFGNILLVEIFFHNVNNKKMTARIGRFILYNLL